MQNPSLKYIEPRVPSIKNNAYIRAKDDYVHCVQYKFDNLVRNHKEFDKAIKEHGNEICQKQIDQLKRVIDEDGLKFDKFLNI